MARFKEPGDMHDENHPADLLAAGGNVPLPNNSLHHEQLKEQQPGSPLARSQPNSALPSCVKRRQTASEFVLHVTGERVPFASDYGFRQALKDGVLLCKLANAAFEGVVPPIKYLEAADAEDGPGGLLAQRDRNIHAFLDALGGYLDARELPLPADCSFGIADLEAEYEERPQVANCLLHIHALTQAQPAQAGAVTPLHQAQAAQQQQHFLQQQEHAAAAAAALATPPEHLQQQQRGSGSGGSSNGGWQQQQQQLITPVGSSSSVGSPVVRLSYAAAGSPGGSGGGSFGMLHSRGSPAGGVCASPLMEGHGSLSSHSHTSLVPARSSSNLGHHHASAASFHGASITAATHKSVQAAAGVTKLMQQCTHMLKERMFPTEHAGGGGGGGSRYSPAGPDSAMKALGPVLEGVLGHLTEEYEKRLLAKDHELSAKCAALAKAEQEVSRLQASHQQLQRDVDERGAAVARAAADASAADAAALQAQLGDAHARLARAEAELADARGALSVADGAREGALRELQAEVDALQRQLAALAGVEERYQRVTAENRQLYNTVQDLRGNIRVFCRIRPPGATGDLSPCCVDVGTEGELAVYDHGSGQKRVFKVDRVFDQAIDQAAVYTDTQPLIRSVLDGFNVCIFAYGQTGSGKTHTMSGTNTHSLEGRGINYRALDDLFAIRDARRDETSYTFRVQMLEIYNEVLRDLLVDGRSAGGANRLDILATQASGCNVPHATQVDVDSAGQVVALMARGATQRATSETKMNDRSSRSHQILTVIVDGFNAVTKAASHGCLHLIDLAGSERVGKSEASGDRLTEAQHINKSLSALGDVMAALAAKERHVPYRNSKLTQLLQDSLQGNAKVMMFMHISPEENMFFESISTLKFATRVSQITLGQAKKNVVSGKVFEAHEEMVRQQRTMENKEQQLQQLAAALEHHRACQAALEAENQALRAELEAARAPPDTGTPSARQRSVLQLPLQQVLAAAAGGAALEGEPGGEAGAGGGDAPSARGAAAGASGGAPDAGAEPAATALGGGAAAGAEAAAAPGSPAAAGVSKIARVRIDKTPLRDQDECSLPSSRSRPTPEASFGDAGQDGTPRAARAGRSAGALRASGMPARESVSSAKHLERLQSARQFGTYKPSTAAAAGRGEAHVGSPGGMSQFASKLAAAAAAVVGKAHGGGAASSRAPPATSRVGGVAGSRRTSDAASGIPSLTSRQSGVFGRSGGGGGGAPGAVTSRGSVTSRAGSRWK